MPALPNQAIYNETSLYVSGGHCQWLTGTTLSIGAGQMRDSTNMDDINLAATVTINTAVNGVNGLDVGALGASSLYAIYVIASSKAGDTTSTNYIAPAGLLSLSFTAPVLPFGYDMFRRVGSVRTSGASALLDFSQRGTGGSRDTYYAANIASPVVAGAATVMTAINLTGTNLVPLTANQVLITGILTSDAGGTRTAAFASQDSSSAAGQVFMTEPASTVFTTSLRVPCSTTVGGLVEINYLVSNAAAALAVNVAGYVDQL